MREWLHDTVLANGLRQSYYFSPPLANKRSLLFLHGFSENGLVWSNLAQVFERDYNIIMLDARWHGLSEGAATGYSAALLAADTAAFIRELNLERPFLFGHSNGALAAAEVAAHYPELVRAIVVEDPPWRAASFQPAPPPTGEPWPGFNAWYSSWLDWHTALRTQTDEERLVASRQFLPPGSSAWPRQELLLHLEAQAQFNLGVMQHAPLVPQASPWLENVQRIRCPMLLLTSDPQKRAMITPEVAQEIAAAWTNPRSKYVSFAGVGHFMHREMSAPQLEQFITTVKAFLVENMF